MMVKFIWSFIFLSGMFFLVGVFTLILFIGSGAAAFLQTTVLFACLGIVALALAIIAFSTIDR